MSCTDAPEVLTFLSHGIYFVESFDEAVDVINSRPDVKEFFIVEDNVTRPAPAIRALYKERRARVFQIRTAGPWNSFFRAIVEVEIARSLGQYRDAADLTFISLISATDFSASLKRHRAVAHLSCREMYWLDTLKYGVEQDDAIELALRTMPSIPAPVKYADLNLQQRLDLSGFEFARFMRPIHCKESVVRFTEVIPYYTTGTFGDTHAAVGTPVSRNLAT